MAEEKWRCKKCDSIELIPFRAGGMLQGKCQDCGAINRYRLVSHVTTDEIVEHTVHGPKVRVERRQNLERAGDRPLEHENRGFRNPRKTYTPGEQE